MRNILGIVTLAAVLGTGGAQSQTLVEGQVLNPESMPAANCSVEAVPIRDNGFAGNLMWTKADDKGIFHLTLDVGRYEIRAKDEVQGYPDPNVLLSLDPEAVFPEVTVSKEPISGVQVRLGPRGGILEGNVRDETTHRAIGGARITIRDVKRPQAFVDIFSDKAGRFRFTVPSRPLSISVSATGYKTITFQGGQAVTLLGGEHNVISVELRPR